MRIVIIGFGRMGSWLARELAAEQEVAVYDRQPIDRQAAANLRVLTSLQEIPGFQPDLLINAVSLQHTLAAFQEILPHTPEGCLLCDLASVKTGLAQFYENSGRSYVSVHPMFGPTFANLEALREENAIIIKESDRNGREFFIEFFARLGVRVFQFSFAEHDQMMAYSLTTPFVATLVFAACVDRAAVPGTTFARHRRIAQGLLHEDDHLLAEVLFNPYSLAQIEKITGRLEFLKHVIKARDFEEAQKLFGKLRKNIEQ